MYLNAKTHPWKASQFQVRDLDSGKIIPHVLWANDESGEYAQYTFDKEGEILLTKNEPDLTIKKGNIKLEEK
jgi:hypothetical protein